MNKKLKIALSMLLVLPLSFTIIRKVNGATEYTVDEIAQHNTADDCWMTFNDNVYDFTTVLDWHHNYQDITSWCGEDMTVAFETKDGIGRDHKPSSYAMLADYLLGPFLLQGTVVEEVIVETIIEPPKVIGEIIDTTEVISETNKNIEISTSTKTKEVKKYNLPIPVGISIILYVGFYLIAISKIGKTHKILSIHSFNLFWNTVLLLSLIPAFGFGIFMVMRIEKPTLNKIDFNFLYWHVELSFVMGTVAIMHFTQRWKQYTMPYKMLTRKKKKAVKF